MKIKTCREHGDGIIISAFYEGGDTQDECLYDGDQYTGDASDDEDLRYAARIEFDRVLRNQIIDGVKALVAR